MEKGALIYINYTVKVKDTGEVLETTIEEEAKKLGIFDPNARYAPKLVAVGEGWVLKGLDEALLKAEAGKKFAVEVPPEKGFGPRDPSKVRLIPLRKFGEKAAQLKAGDEVEVDGRVGVVRFVGSGRVQVDFNHRLAGKTLIYDVEVIKELVKKEEKAKALIARRLAIDEDKVTISFENGKARIEIPEELYLTEGLQYIKRAIAQDLFKFLADVFEVIFEETYTSPEKAKKEPEKKPKRTKRKKATQSTPVEEASS